MIDRPESGTAEGLLGTLQHGLRRLNIHGFTKDECKGLVGIGTDRAAVNIADGGLKGLVEKELPWVYWSWCFAHRLELAINNAFKGTFFDSIDEMLLRLYYLYEKSLKKLRELEGIVADLKVCFEFDENGVKPVRSCGTRWICHKLNAMKRVISKYGVYIAQLTALCEDNAVKAPDRAKLKGYLKKWVDAKYLLGCTAFADILTPCSILSKSLQSDSIDILGALMSILRTIKETRKLSTMAIDQWPMYSATLQKVRGKEEPTFQLQVLKNFQQAKNHYDAHYLEYCSQVTACIQKRLAWSS